MPNSPHQRRWRDIAYMCFLIPGACAFLGTIGGLIASWLDIEPAYLGFFVLFPLMLISAVTILVAIVLILTIVRREPALILLFIASIVVVVEGLTEFGGAFFAFNVVPALYGLLVLVLEANWFFVRRKTFNEPGTAA
jgi:hypothetical protein